MTEAEGLTLPKEALDTGALALTAGPTGARVRTRWAILDAAASQLAKDATSSLSQIAKAAGVGRTTLHRYYPDRASLLTALADDASKKLIAAHENAKLTEGTAAEALERLCQEYIGLLDHLALFFTETITDDPFSYDSDFALDVKKLITRGHKDGTIDSRLSKDWLLTTLWALLYTLWETTISTGALSMHDAVAQLLLTVNKVVLPSAPEQSVTKPRRSTRRTAGDTGGPGARGASDGGTRLRASAAKTNDR